jgi:hypothetical protein
MDEKQTTIIIQVAAKIAADLTVAFAEQVEEYPQFLDRVQDDLMARIEDAIAKRAANTPQVQQQFAPGTPAYASNVIQGAFPGAQQVAGYPQQAPSQSAPTQGLTKDQMWADVINNPDNWFNNLTDPQAGINGGTRPDFRHKTMVNQRGRKVGLYLVDTKYGKHAPKFVFDHFGLPYPAQAVPAQPQVTQFPPQVAQVQQQPLQTAPYYPPEAPF